MPFDITTAKPVKKGGFDITTAKPVTPTRETISPTIPPLIKGQQEREAIAEKLIAERTDPVEVLRKEVETPFKFGTPAEVGKSLLKPAVTVSKIASIPIQRLSAGAGGLGLGLQQQKGVKESLKMAGEGLLGKKQFKTFDVARTAGLPEPLDKVLPALGDLAVEIAVPMKVLGSVNKLFRGPIQKMSDTKLLNIGKRLTKGAEDAVNKVGGRLNKVYKPINKVKVAAKNILDDVAELPQSIIKHIERTVGNVDEFLQDFTIEKARKLKQTIGEIRPGAFGKAGRGAPDLVIDRQINTSYAKVKQAMQEALDSAGLKKEASKLLKADDAFSETMNAARFVKKTVTDPTLKAPTKAGRAASGLEREADVTFRESINTLRKSGFFIRQNLNQAVEGLESFNQLQNIKKFAGALGRTAVFGAVAGGAASRLLGGDQ